ncbi:2'-5' RNA ligase family protein [Nocardioides houyundeii]|uniref:2'-5' RNA ligase family protein n=1 Tax=Nocardioides houyundeii TaxID=2045452 RepID=UPI001315998E|nr:2'-5' RNA ligase family protein [Nocardioides houyundeii]
MPDHALELSFEPSSTAAVVAQWDALKAAGLPSQADHRSMTNAPHLTLVAAVGIEDEVVRAARETIGPLLPARIGLRGLVLFGQGARVTIAHLVEPDQALAAATARIRALVPALRHPVWTPHVTLARRVPRSSLPAALEALHSTEAARELVCDRLRWWDPTQDLIEDVAVAGRD